MIDVDTQQLARFERIGHRISGDRRQGCFWGAGDAKVYVAIDDASRLAYVEVLPDVQMATTHGFLTRAVGWFGAQGMTCRRVLSDHGSAYRSGEWRMACSSLDLWPIRSRLCTPGLQLLGFLAHSHQALHSRNQGQSRELWPPADFVTIKTLLGVCSGLQNLRGTQPLPAPRSLDQ